MVRTMIPEDFASHEDGNAYPVKIRHPSRGV